MTDHGLKYVLARLADCPNLDALRRVWDSLGDEYKRSPEVQAHKARLKAGMQKAAVR